MLSSIVLIGLTSSFREAAKIFNGAIQTHAIILVKPLNAQDVST